MSIISQKKQPDFLSGGGELGELTRKKEWGNTSVGDPENWPQSLRTTISIILNSKFPMFLWWGPDLICFYNDAYRPSLGENGKHPSILGMKAKEAWPEIWDIIYPLIRQVQTTGESTWSENQLVPIYRNGKIEDVYWTFSYSPVYDDWDKPAGVLVTCTETTEKVVYLKALAESNDQLQFAIEATELGTWDFNPGTNKFTGNRRLKEWFGLEGKEEIELPLAISIIAEKDRQRVFDAIQYVLQFSSGGLYDIEYTIVHPADKKERIVRAKGRAWFNDDKIANRFNGTLQDITDQVIARRRIEESERNMRLMILQAPVAICIFRGPQYILEIVNPRMEVLLGRKASGLEGSPFFDVVPEMRGHGLDSVLEGIMKNGNSFLSEEQQFQLPRGSNLETFFVTYIYEPMKDADGNITGIMVMAIDVTEQVIIRKQIEEREDQFRTLADNIQNLAWMADADGSVFWYNKQWYAYTATTLEETKGWGWEKVHHPDHIKRVVEFVKEAWQKNEPWELTFPLRGHNGNYRWFLTRAFPVCDSEGKITRWIGTNTDIDEQKSFAEQLEQKVNERTEELNQQNNLLEQQNLALEKMNKELASFAYISSHDLQEPLRKIQMFASRIMEKEINVLSETGKNYFKRMEVSANRMQQLIHDLFSYSHTNTAEKKFTKINLNNLLEEVKEELNEKIVAAQAVIESQELPEMEVIPFQFKQLFINIISNSLKFADPTKAPRIKINCSITEHISDTLKTPAPSKKYYLITITDNGIGFEPQFNEQIFGVFQRLHGRSEYEGTGIGLAIVKKIVENHNGMITAKGEPAKGASFNIYIPVNQH